MNNLKLNSKDRFKVKMCPCGKSNKDGKFVPFEGHTNFGYCHSCAETILPNDLSKSDFTLKATEKRQVRIQHIPFEYLTKSINRYTNNNFLCFLKERFGVEKTNKVIDLYKIGDSKNWFGATIFWQLDKNNAVRTGKIMLYNRNSGKRVKEPYDHINWTHNKLKIPNENIDKCLFGEHLLTMFPNKQIAIVESEKTAVIASLFYPNFNWMATGGIGNLNYGKIKSLIGKPIMLIPDLCAYDLWMEKAKQLEKCFRITVSDFLEKNASDFERNEKFDLADFLLKYELSDFSVKIL